LIRLKHSRAAVRVGEYAQVKTSSFIVDENKAKSVSQVSPRQVCI